MDPNGLLNELVAEAHRLEEEALYNYAGHNEEARASERLHKYLGIPTTVVAAAAGVTSFSAAGVTSLPAADVGAVVSFWTSIAAGGLSFGVAAMSGLTTFLDPKGRSAQHYEAANAYIALHNEIRYFHRIECKKAMPIEELDGALIRLRERLRKLDEETPIITAAAMNKATALIQAGYYIPTVDRRGEVREADQAAVSARPCA